MSAVVCHAGHNTVCEALANGLPLVVAPIRDDQPVVAQQVVRAGAGLRVRYGKLTPSALKEAVMRVLDEPSFKNGALAIRDSFARAGGVDAAASSLQSFAGGGTP
jgi:UDP:flavonoid glycosyltransferase YjiC (YdhE family)